jgi:hypothetical protein
VPLRRVSKIDDNTLINPLSRDQFRYREIDHELLFVAELMAHNPERTIYPSSIRAWLPPYDAEPITEARRADILKKICKYFDNNEESYQIAE